MYKINNLLKLNHQLFHTNDLALVWDIRNRNTLYTTIKRYIQKGILIPVHKGLYSTVPLSEINPLLLGVYLNHFYTYLSTETVLSKHNIIFQNISNYTYVCAVSKKISISGLSYKYRQLKNKYLYNNLGITVVDGVMSADAERATADILYFNPKYHFDNPKAINWSKTKIYQKQIGYI